MDIVERLRQAETAKDFFEDWKVYKEAADEIERLQEKAHYHYENGLKKDVEIDRLREALQTIAEEDSGWGQYVAFTTLKERE